MAAALALAGALLTGGVVYRRAEAGLAQILLGRAFTAELASATVVKPWPGADTWPVARIEVPRLGAAIIVPDGDSGQLALGPAHLSGTPEAGESGVAVYAAHRDTHFAFLGQVAPGDAIVVTRRDGTVVRFRAAYTEVVRWDASGIDPGAPGRRLALVTCWPLDAILPGSLRYVVYAELEGP
jgi:sortase A